MHTITVRLERLFDVQRNVGGKDPHVLFSCVADGERHFSVRLPDSPRLEVGDRVTVVLRSPGNWQSIVGWKNHANGEVILPGFQGLIVLPVTTAFAVFSSWSWLHAKTSNGRVMSAVGTVVMLIVSMVLFEQARDALRARRLLKDS